MSDQRNNLEVLALELFETRRTFRVDDDARRYPDGIGLSEGNLHLLDVAKVITKLAFDGIPVTIRNIANMVEGAKTYWLGPRKNVKVYDGGYFGNFYISALMSVPQTPAPASFAIDTAILNLSAEIDGENISSWFQVPISAEMAIKIVAIAKKGFTVSTRVPQGQLTIPYSVIFYASSQIDQPLNTPVPVAS